MSAAELEIAEVKKLLGTATFTGTKALLQGYLNKLEAAEAERKRKAATLSEAEESLPAPPSKPATTAQVAGGAFYVPIEDFAWDQGEYNSPTVSIFIELEGVGSVKDKVKTSFTKNSFDVKVTGLKGKNYRLIKDNLDKDIVPDQSKCIVKNNKIVLKLRKVKGEYSYEHWTSLTSKTKKTDKDGAKKDPMGGIMDMMKDMYDEGDDNMKKVIGEAMLKSQRGEKPDQPPLPGSEL